MSRLGSSLALGVVALALLPLAGLWSAWIAPPPDPLGLGPTAFADLWARSGALTLLVRTLGLGLCVGGIVLPLGTWLAWVEQRCEYRGRVWLGIGGLLPLAVPSYILAGTLREALGPGGAFGRALGLGVFSGFGPAILALALVTLPYVQLLVGAALRRQSAAEEEAARSLGASPRRVFQSVVLPRLRPSLAYAGLIAGLYVISDFGAVAVLDCPVLTWRLYQAVDHQQLQQAVLLGAALLLVALPLLAGARWLHGSLPRLEQVANPRPATPRPLRGLPLLATHAAHAAVIGLGVALPLVTQVAWLGDGLRYDLGFAALGEPLLHSLGVALGAAALTLALAFAPAWAAARTSSRRFAAALEHGTYLTSALPGVLLAFGLMLVVLGAARGLGSRSLYAALLSSGALLALGLAMRFIAEGYGGLKVAVQQVDPRHEEAARSLGVPRRRWLRRIVAPALAPGVAASFVLLFLAVLKELPVTLLLGGAAGLRPLSYRVYDRYQEAFLHDAGLAGLVMMALALACVLATLGYRRHV